MKTGVLLLNLGTPKACSIKAVAAYLGEFLMDKRVIALPFVLRILLIYFIIIPLRIVAVTKAYRKIWTAQGSPLLVNSQKIAGKLQTKLGKDYIVSLAMRYSAPSIKSQIKNLVEQPCKDLIIIPLYPQYSSAASGSAIEQVLQALKATIIFPNIKIISNFYAHKNFIQAWAELIKINLNNKNYDLLLFSYHGLPEKQNYGYRDQCYITTDLIAKELGIDKNKYTVSFQSRLGRTPWIKPYTDVILADLRRQGIKNIAICCPSFVADCLETIEEIGIRAKQSWQDAGGKDLHLIPCINDVDLLIECLSSLITSN